MKLLILKEKLKEGLSIVNRITTKSLSLPILENVLLKTEKNFLNLSTTDLEIGINFWTLAKIEKEGKIVLPGQIFSNFINFLPEEKISLEEKNLALKIECKNYKTQLKGINPEDFPIIPQLKTEEIISINGEVFCQGLEQVVGIASSSTTRPEISGVLFIFEKDFIKMVATDSFRLAEKTIFLEKPFPLRQQYSLIIPQKTAKEVVNIFGDKKEELKIHLSPNQILFEKIMPEAPPHPQIHLISRLIEGEYPNYQEIIPQKYQTQIVVQKNEFLNQIKTASLFSGKINEIKLKISPKEKKVTVLSQTPDLGEYQSFFPAKIKGEEISISFNHRFLSEGLVNAKGTEIIFEISEEGGPAILKTVEDESYFYIVMPIKAS